MHARNSPKQLPGGPAPVGADQHTIKRKCRRRSRVGGIQWWTQSGGAHAPPARTPTTSSGDYGYGSRLLFPLQQLKLQNKDIDHTYFTHIMAANNTSRCVRFGDGTPPLCHANNLPQGQLCQQCDNEDRSARNTHENSCLLYTSPSPRDKRQSRMPSSA